MHMAIRQFTNKAAWPPNPVLRGRDLVSIAMACAGAAIVAIVIVAAFDTLWKFPTSSIELGSEPAAKGSNFWPMHLGIAASYAYFLLIVHAFLVRRNSHTWRSLGFQSFGWKWLPIALAAGGVLFIAGEWFTDILDVGEDAETYNRSLFLVDGATALTIAVEISVIGPATAAIEELLFRGLLHRWIRQRLGLIAGTAASAAIFSLVHFSFYDPGGIIGWYWTAEIAAIGVVLALLYEWSGSLWPPIAVHAANNVAAVVLAHMGV